MGKKNLSKDKNLNIILKCDVLGSEEAILESLVKIHRSEEMAINVIAQGLGNVTEGDVMQAYAGQAQIFGLHIKATKASLILAQEKKFQ